MFPTIGCKLYLKNAEDRAATQEEKRKRTFMDVVEEDMREVGLIEVDTEKKATPRGSS